MTTTPEVVLALTIFALVVTGALSAAIWYMLRRNRIKRVIVVILGELTTLIALALVDVRATGYMLIFAVAFNLPLFYGMYEAFDKQHRDAEQFVDTVIKEVRGLNE
jgi:hypothetical protein